MLMERPGQFEITKSGRLYHRSAAMQYKYVSHRLHNISKYQLMFASVHGRDDDLISMLS